MAPKKRAPPRILLAHHEHEPSIEDGAREPASSDSAK
jgi:hypothetical protein